MSKRNVKKVVAVAVADPLKRRHDIPQTLLLKRRGDDDRLPGVWTVLAGALRSDERWTDALYRVAYQKLVSAYSGGPTIIMPRDIEPVEGHMQRSATQGAPADILHMVLCSARLKSGYPTVPNSKGYGNRYSGFSWVPLEVAYSHLRDVSVLLDGSLSAALLLWRDGKISRSDLADAGGMNIGPPSGIEDAA